MLPMPLVTGFAGKGGLVRSDLILKYYVFLWCTNHFAVSSLALLVHLDPKGIFE
jgi:hypothetical protein